MDPGSGVADQLAAGTTGGTRLDVAAAIADHARQPVSTVVASLDAVRDAASWFQPLTAFLGAMVALGAAGGLVWLHRRSPTRLLLVLAIALVLAGAVQLSVWALAVHLVPTPFDEATSAGPSGWKLPAGLRGLLFDIQEELVDVVTRSAGWMALLAIVAGMLLAATALVLGSRRSGSRARNRRILVATCGAAAVAVAAATLIVVDLASPPVERACNGDVALCDRHYDDVVFAATHNSMSSPDVVRFWPEQDDSLSQQLDAGVRALLIDTHYWLPVRSPSGLIDVQQAIDAAEPRLPATVADALYPLLGTLRNGREGTFLCHLQCAFGAIPFVDAMVTVRQFLEANPDEVVTLIVQDAISTADTEAAMDAAGLGPYLYQHRPDDRWPTLGQMIDSGQRLVVFAEGSGPPPSWYANAFEEMQETTFTASSPADFSCAANRGRADAPLFLMNHWVVRVPPDRVNATIVNTKDALVARARECERERGLEPNFLAVDFSNIGDVVGAADVLNGVS